MAKQEVINRIETIAEIANSHDNGYHYEVVVSEWVKYGKDRTYFSIVETRDGSKHYVKKSYGYFDNNADTYVNGRGDANINYDFGGNNKVENILAARAAEEAAKAAETETTTTAVETKEEPEMKETTTTPATRTFDIECRWDTADVIDGSTPPDVEFCGPLNDYITTENPEQAIEIFIDWVTEPDHLDDNFTAERQENNDIYIYDENGELYGGYTNIRWREKLIDEDGDEYFTEWVYV